MAELAQKVRRLLPVGADPQTDGVHFRVWAPDHEAVAVVVEGLDARPLTPASGGHFEGFVPGIGPGALYRYRPGRGRAYPDPASRFQPQGPHGPSMVVDPTAFRWTDAGWLGRPLAGQVIYELHVGTFTREGTFAAAARELPRLAEIGVTTLELMPLATFPGAFGWGYDGVDLYAPSQLYGTPDDLRALVDRAHGLGLGVILDVVYNHLGPSGNYLTCFAAAYHTDRYTNEWGDPINFDGPGSDAVRTFVVANAGYWIREFHMDGLRLDATQQIFDASPRSILAEIASEVRAAAAGRATVVVAENEPQDARLLRPAAPGGPGLDALWNDDFHHSAVAALVGHNEAYYTDHLGRPQEFVSALKHGWLFQGQVYSWQGKRRGSPTRGLPAAAFVNFLENHDQVANSARGWRLDRRACPGALRALTAVLLLGPATPMLFQGQEYQAPQPFLYFADHEPDLARKVAGGRTAFVTQFPSIAEAVVCHDLDDPSDPRTFAACKLNSGERHAGRHAEALSLHRDLIALRRDDPTFRAQGSHGVDGAVLGPEAYVMRFPGPDGPEGDRLLLVNLGVDQALLPAPEPLLAPPLGFRWRVLWHSEAPCYGGCGLGEVERAVGWRLPGRAAVVLAPGPEDAAA